ncbi:MAG: 50S ribosomal protein L25 [Nitrospiraceae bacterium]|nr:50S ribosomal protein L25 [Nitrospiraceae bacterium]
MDKMQSLKAQTRKASGSGDARRARHAGTLPASLYGGGQDPASVSVDLHEFDVLIHHSRAGEHAILQLDFDDQPELNSPVLVKAVQHHPLTGYMVHADFMRIRLDQRINTFVQVILTGQAEGVVEGGVLDHQLRELEVECLALEVPDEIVVDITGLNIGDSVHVGALQVPENVTVISDADRPVVAVHAPRVVEEEVEVEGEEGEEGIEGEEGGVAEPEVVGEKKDEE